MARFTWIVIAVIAGSSLGCGYGAREEVVIRKKNPTPVQVSWAEIKPLVDAECNRCHGVSLEDAFTEETFRASQGRIENGSMPPDKELDADTKAALLSY